MKPLGPGVRLRIGAVFAFLIASLDSWRAIPQLKPWGADLHNLQIFHVCAHGASPYPIDGATCGDFWGRPMIYPPLMYHSFFWLRPLKLETAMYCWATFLVLAFSGVLYAWARLSRRERRAEPPVDVAATVAFGVLLLLQFPFVFSLERGSTDIGAVLFWTMSAFLFDRKRLFLAGAAAGIATSYKLFPVFPCFVITSGLAIAHLRARTFARFDFLRFAGGIAASFIGTNAFFSDARHYFFSVLPAFATTLTDGDVYSHSIPSFIGPDFPTFAKVVGLALLAVWVYAAQAALAERSALVFAGALAMSTFGQGTSWDYNLTTTYPLLLLLFLDAMRTGKFGLLAFGVFSICGNRVWFAQPSAELLTPSSHLCLELAFLALAAMAIARETNQEAEPELAPKNAP